MVPRPKNLTNEERIVFVQFILEGSVGGKPIHGKLLEAQHKFQISTSTVTRMWRSTKQQKASGQAIQIISMKKGRKKDHNKQPNHEILKGMDLSERGCYRSMSFKMGVNISTLQRWAKAGLFKIFRSYLKPSLTTDCKFLRLRFSFESLELDRVMNTLRYQTMHNTIQIDEKWFFINKGKNRYYMAPDEDEPYRACKSKKFVGKIMFLCAVSRPIIGEDGTFLFDSKIGWFPLQEILS